MTADTRIPQPPGTRGMFKASKPLASASVKRHSPVPKLKSTKVAIWKSRSSSSSSDSSSEKECLTSDIAIAKGTQETAKNAASILSSASAVETAGKELVFDDFFMERISHRTISDVAAEATARPNATPESINNDDFGGAIGMVCSTIKPLQQENSNGDDKVFLDELTDLETDDVRKGKDGSLTGFTVPKQPEGIGEVKLAFENLMREAGHGIAAAWSGCNWRGIKFLLAASLLILCTVLFCVENLIEDELDHFPPPT